MCGGEEGEMEDMRYGAPLAAARVDESDSVALKSPLLSNQDEFCHHI